MGTREERFWTKALRVTVLHWIPACVSMIAPQQTFRQARLACQVSFTSILIHETAIFQIIMISVLCTQYELKIYVSIELSIHTTSETRV